MPARGKGRRAKCNVQRSHNASDQDVGCGGLETHRCCRGSGTNLEAMAINPEGLGGWQKGADVTSG